MRRTQAFCCVAVVVVLACSLPACGTQVGSVTASPAASGSAVDLETVPPETVGISSQRLGRLSAAMQQLVDAHRLAGITTMVARHGKVAHLGTFGQRDVEAKASMAPDTIFRIYSMSKPITGVALMMLYRGR